MENAHRCINTIKKNKKEIYHIKHIKEFLSIVYIWYTTKQELNASPHPILINLDIMFYCHLMYMETWSKYR